MNASMATTFNVFMGAMIIRCDGVCQIDCFRDEAADGLALIDGDMKLTMQGDRPASADATRQGGKSLSPE
jgi:hypothetical protein